jgi:hypothetical protein
MSAASSHTEREPIAPIRHPDVDELPTPAGSLGVDVLLAVVGPHDPGHDRHRMVEGVLGLAGAGVVEDGLAGDQAVAC